MTPAGNGQTWPLHGLISAGLRLPFYSVQDYSYGKLARDLTQSERDKF